VKLLDFGIAKLDNLSGETKTGIIKGKLGYMPLEQVEGRTLDNRADLFPIGVMIWEAVARRRMWENQSDAGVIKHILQKNIPCLRAAAPSVDEELVRICKKATAGDRDDRYSSARELLGDLQTFLEKSAGVATEHAISQWINTSCSDLKTSARQEMDSKLALFSKQTGSRSMAQNARRSSTHATGESVRERTGSQQRRAAPDGATDEGFGGQTLSARFDAPRRRWAMLAAAVALAGGALFMRQALLEPTSGQGSLPTRRGAASAMGPLGSAAAASAVASSADGLKLAAPPAVMPSGAGQGIPSAHDGASAARPAATAPRAPDTNARLATAQPKAPQPKAPQPKAVRRTTPQRAPVTPSARPPSAPVSESPAAPKPAASRCDTPFAVDAAGIKRYRRECLAR
jgi:serine/threonine-protein kinase